MWNARDENDILTGRASLPVSTTAKLEKQRTKTLTDSSIMAS